MRSLRYLAIILMVAATAAVGPAAEHGSHIALLVAQQGLEAWDAEMEAGTSTPELLPDGRARRNLAETNLNWAVALLESGERSELAQGVIEAVLEHQDLEDGSKTRGLFRWYADPAQPYSADATLYLAPALAHLAKSGRPEALQDRLRERAAMALEGLLSADRPKDSFGAAMWAGAVASLADAADQPAALDAAAKAVSGLLTRLKREGAGSIHSPTFDALRIGGLRWALEFAGNEAAQTEASTALRICYADMLQRYDPATAMVTGAIGTAYPADYLGDTGVAQYLLACDLPSALAQVSSPSPLAMYFALSDYELTSEQVAMAEAGGKELEIRARTPVSGEVEYPPLVEGEEELIAPAEARSTCTWVTEGMSLGTMSGEVGESTIPIMATCDLPERPTTYLYPFGGTATVQSAQSRGLAVCSFNFDGVGMGTALRAGVQGMLGRRDHIDRVLIGHHEWIGEPEAVGQNTVVAVRRGSSYVGIKILWVGGAGGTASSVKPAGIEWLREGNMDSLMLRVYARRGNYPLSEPMYDVRIGLLVEVAAASEFGSLEQFSEHVAGRKVSHSTSEDAVRIDNQDSRREIPGRHEIKTGAEIRFAKFLYHQVALEDETLPLGMTEELLRNRLISRTLPVELPAGYLWASPGLNLQQGAEPIFGPLPSPPAAEEAAGETPG